MLRTTHSSNLEGNCLYFKETNLNIPCIVDCGSEFTPGSDVGVDSSLVCALGVSVFELGILLA